MKVFLVIKIMKKILLINSSDIGSTGKISISLKNYYEKKGHSVYFATFIFNEKNKNDTSYLSMEYSHFSSFINKIKCRMGGGDGFFHKGETKKLIKKIETINPDVVHLHNLHGSYINMEILFDYLVTNKIKTIWTLHDCWAFTGRCPYFTMSNCLQWQTHCKKCPWVAKRNYPAAYIINKPSKYFEKKIRIINNAFNILTLVTPSNWLLELLERSKIKNVKSMCINNGIDYIETINENAKNFLSNLNIDKNKIIIFAAAYPFGKRKGIDFIKEVSYLIDYSKYEFIVVGLTKKQEKEIKKNIVSTGVIKDASIMQELFRVSDYFINPTLEDNFPTVNLESLAAGTPVITFKTGGSPEVLTDDCGIVIEEKTTKALLEAINSITKKNTLVIEKCKKQSTLFSEKLMLDKYYKLVIG